MFEHLILVLTASTAWIQPPPGPINLDFEDSDLGQAEAGWSVPAAVAESYGAEFVTEQPKSGKRCALITNKGTPQSGLFGNLMQSFDARPFRGQRVRFQAAVRTELDDQASAALLWLRVDRAGGQMGFFDNMGDRPIRAKAWEEFTISGPIAPDAAFINIGCMLSGTGKVWLDAVTFEVLGPVGEGQEKPKALTDRGVDNLVAFTRLFGYVRHFHPSDAATAADWGDLAIRGVRAAEAAASAEELAGTLEIFFRPIAPTVRVFVTGRSPDPPADLTMPKDATNIEVIAWRHDGFGQKDQDRSSYHSKRARKRIQDGKIPDGFADPNNAFTADLGGGISCSVPLTLYADEKGTLPHATREPSWPPHPNGFEPSGNDRATRLADVILIWNVLQHFYPYFDVVKTDWPAALREALRTAAEDKDEAEFLKTLRRLVAKIHDGHGGVYGPGVPGWATPPILWDWVENALVVTKTAPGYQGRLKPGDVIVKVNDQTAAEALAELEELISGATPQWRRTNSLRWLALGEPASKLTLEIRPRSGETFTETLVRTMRDVPLGPDRPEPIEEIKPGIFYVDLGRITDDQFTSALPKLELCQGIVFDLRGYPSGVNPNGIIGHFIDQPVTCPQWHIPKVSRPDREGMEFTFSNWPVMPTYPRLKAKVAYITGGGAISYAETWMGIIEHYKLAVIVGGPTAGTNGNVNPVALPGGYHVSWTGMKVLKHDGSQHHGIGIQPTLPVEPTIQGVAEGRDEPLERAVQELLK